jgi:hypothetical protein
MKSADNLFDKHRTGRYTENTMWYLVGGLIGIVIGVALLLRGGKSD